MKSLKTKPVNDCTSAAVLILESVKHTNVQMQNVIFLQRQILKKNTEYFLKRAKKTTENSLEFYGFSLDRCATNSQFTPFTHQYHLILNAFISLKCKQIR